MLAGRPHEAAGNGSPRWMAVGPLRRAHRTRPTGRLTRRLRRGSGLPPIILARIVAGGARQAGRRCCGPGSIPGSTQLILLESSACPHVAEVAVATRAAASRRPPQPSPVGGRTSSVSRTATAAAAPNPAERRAWRAGRSAPPAKPRAVRVTQFVRDVPRSRRLPPVPAPDLVAEPVTRDVPVGVPVRAVNRSSLSADRRRVRYRATPQRRHLADCPPGRAASDPRQPASTTFLDRRLSV